MNDEEFKDLNLRLNQIGHEKANILRKLNNRENGIISFLSKLLLNKFIKTKHNTFVYIKSLRQIDYNTISILGFNSSLKEFSVYYTIESGDDFNTFLNKNIRFVKKECFLNDVDKFYESYKKQCDDFYKKKMDFLDELDKKETK